MMELEKSLNDSESQRRLYNLRPVQVILNMLLTRNIRELKPIFDLQYRCRYPEAENVSQLEPAEVIGTLENMSIHSILDAHFHDRIPVCDKCASANLTIVYLCTYCKSRNIEKNQLVEHSSCGYIDVEERYIKGSETVCPRCNSNLRMNSTDVKIQGGWFSCKSCSRWHHEPNLILTCRECERMMSIRDVSFADMFSYTLHNGLDLRSIIFPENIRKSLEELGYQAESPGVLMGKTGIKHQFDIVCNNENITTAIDVV
jgi:Thaumarchaeal output domain 1